MAATREEIVKFSNAVMDIVRTTDYNHYEAVIEYCKQTNMEIELAATLISPALKSRIWLDGQEANMFKEKSARLPI